MYKELTAQESSDKGGLFVARQYRQRGTALLAALLLGVCGLWPCAALPAEAEQAAPAIFTQEEGRLLEENVPASFSFRVEQTGTYILDITYQVPPDKPVTPQGSLRLAKGETVVKDETVEFPRIWRSVVENGRDGRFEQDTQGNELMPTQEEVVGWQTASPSLGEDDGLFLEAGEYTLHLTMTRQNIVVRRIGLRAKADREDYASYRARYADTNVIGTAQKPVRQEAELYHQKSHLEILLSYDRISAAVSPNDPSRIRYNILGGSGYGKDGQWVSWTIDVPETGLYALDVVYRQNDTNGFSVRRRLTIDGVVPFRECEALLFPYAADFTSQTIGDETGSPYLFYLEKGKRELKLEVVTTGLYEVLDELSAVVAELNRLYSRIMVLVGETPDHYRDYDLDKHIDNLVPTLQDCAARLNALGKAIDADADSSIAGSGTSRLYETARLLETMAKKVREIPKQMDNFRSQINTLADLMGSLRSQSLELDYLVFRSPDQTAETAGVSFWKQLGFRFRAFLASFFQDYDTIDVGEYAGKPLQVWASTNDLTSTGYATGRDQAQILSRLITDSFTPSTGIPVTVSLINSADTLLPALVSGKGPDVAVFVPKTVLMNLFYRNALVDLTTMPDYESVAERFFPSSLISMQVGERTYGLPEIQSYNMLFYRTDIFEEQQLEPPQTWEDFYAVLARLQKNGMQVGIEESTQIYEMFLLQNGGTLYNADMSRTNMTEQASIDAFTSWTNLYSKYGLPLSFDILNRFRTGQMPMVIATSYFYGQVSVGAPEIAGQWKMAMVPGTVREDGTVDHTEVCRVSASVVMESSSRRDEAFRFLNWWTLDETQERFGLETEAKMGSSARYFPANKNAFETLAWTADEAKVLRDQWQQVSDNPQSPAAYYVTRNLSNAFRRVAYEYENPRDVIFRYGRIVDDELTRKRVELGLEESR